MQQRLAAAALAILSAFATATSAHGQGAAGSSLSGIVADSAGGLIPGVTVVVKNTATGATFETITNGAGAFSVPALDAGTYTVTISLAGFKTAVVNDVRLITNTPGSIRVTLEVGNLEETITVQGGTELVQTQSATVASTITTEQISNLPLVSRNALNFVTFLPGVETTGGPRGSTISGLPQNTINVTLDGVNVNNNFQSTDGFFSMIVPRLDAVEEVTVTGATPGADQAGQGAVQVSFVTRAGTNNLSGSIYHYFRHPELNSNYKFNELRGLGRNEVIVHQYGGRVGGPIVIPGLFDGRNKAFFFFNHEEFYQPTEASRTRALIHPRAAQGLFRYTVAVNGQPQVREIDLLGLAAANGHVATLDPTTSAMMARIRSAAMTTGTINDHSNPSVQQYFYQSAATGRQHAPTGRVDVNLGANHRLSGTYYWQRFVTEPDILNNNDAAFPGLANVGNSTSYRTAGSASVRSTLSSNMVNEARYGWQWSPLDFSGNVRANMFDEQAGFGWNYGNNGINMLGMTTPGNLTGVEERNTTNWNVDNTLNWLRGAHSFSFGGSFTQFNHVRTIWNEVPNVQFGVDVNNDPAAAMFSTANFPGASTANLTDARNLYGLVTGRLTAINAFARLDEVTNQYAYLGRRTERVRLNEIGVFAQDSWRLTPAVTLNAGVRWELQLPMEPLNDSFSMSTFADLCGRSGLGTGPGGRGCALFQPNVLGGIQPTYVQYDSGNPGYDTDWNNFAPNVGLAWRPNVQDGWLRALLGDPEQATLRGGYSVAFTRERMDRFTNLYSANPGAAINANRTGNQGNLVYLGESWPVLLRDPARLGPPAFPLVPAYPLSPSPANGDDINIFDPALEVPTTRSWTVGFQRALSKDTAVEIRYVGTRLRNGWATENWNEANLIENGFLNEFRTAQANLRANLAAGRGSTFAYTGAPGTAPLPIYLAYFSGQPASRASDTAAYASTSFANAAWLGHLGLYEPDPKDAADDLHANATFRTNALNAGLPANFFVLNPDVDDANITRGVLHTKYDAMQIELRRRLSRGLTIQANYTFARAYDTEFDTLRRDRAVVLQDDGIPHAFKINWLYELPFGRGRRYAANLNPWLNGVVGGWEFSGSGRMQVRDFAVNVAGNNPVGAVKLVGMSTDELRDAFTIRVVDDPATGAVTVFNLPQDIVDNTRRAFNTDPTSATGYSALGVPTGRYIAPASDPGCIAVYPGDCTGIRNLYVRGPLFTRYDFSFKKRFPFAGRASFDLQVDFLNVFDNVNYNPQFNPGDAATTFQVTTAYTDINTTFDPGGRLGQIIWRVNW